MSLNSSLQCSNEDLSAVKIPPSPLHISFTIKTVCPLFAVNSSLNIQFYLYFHLFFPADEQTHWSLRLKNKIPTRDCINVVKHLRFKITLMTVLASL